MAEALPPRCNGVNLPNGYDSEWQLIGELVEIITYPIDTGFGFATSYANVTKYGMTSMNFAQMTFLPFRVYHFKMEDRTLIAVRNNNAVLFDSEVEEIHHTTIINELDMARRVDLPHRINYLDHPTEVYSINTEATRYHISMSRDITKDLPCDFAYFPQDERCDNFSKFTENPDETNNGYLANYSPFMLINKTSLEVLREETGRQDLSVKHFRPNFVINATTPYCEENISELKIGTEVEFQNIIPCTHTNTEVVRMVNNVEEKVKLSQILQRRNRLRYANYPCETERSPITAFGMNMQSMAEGEVEIGHEVYAKFHKRA